MQTTRRGFLNLLGIGAAATALTPFLPITSTNVPKIHKKMVWVDGLLANKSMLVSEQNLHIFNNIIGNSDRYVMWMQNPIGCHCEECLTVTLDEMRERGESIPHISIRMYHMFTNMAVYLRNEVCFILPVLEEDEEGDVKACDSWFEHYTIPTEEHSVVSQQV